MGGFGSGRNLYATTPTVGQSADLPAQDCLKDLLSAPEVGDTAVFHVEIPVWERGAWAPERYGWLKLALRVADLAPSGDRYATVRALWLYDLDGVDATHQRLAVERDERTVTAPTHDEPATGYQFYWRCPDCGERRQQLRNPFTDPFGDRFACRECHALGYYSERITRSPRKVLRHRANLVRERMGGDRLDTGPLGSRDYRVHAPAPERPPTMPRERYAALRRELEAIRERFDRLEREQLLAVSSATPSAPGLTEVADRAVGRGEHADP